jgi:hypothetical protein
MAKEELKPIDVSKYKVTETGQVLKMTELEKEAEEFKERTQKQFLEMQRNGGNPSLWANLDNIWKDGAEFGYSKANEWHYVKDGKPKDNEYVLIYTDIKNVYIARLVEDNYFITNKGGFVQTSAVIAWKEIVLPKE